MTLDPTFNARDAVGIAICVLFLGLAFGIGLGIAELVIPEPERAPIRMEHVEVRKCEASPRVQPNTL